MQKQNSPPKKEKKFNIDQQSNKQIKNKMITDHLESKKDAKKYNIDENKRHAKIYI